MRLFQLIFPSAALTHGLAIMHKNRLVLTITILQSIREFKSRQRSFLLRPNIKMIRQNWGTPKKVACFPWE